MHVCAANGKSFLNKRQKILLLLLHQAEKLDVHVCIEKLISVGFKVELRGVAWYKPKKTQHNTEMRN